MPQPYNLTNVSSSENILELTQYTNDITGGWLGILIMVSFLFILFVNLQGSSPAVRFTTASFLTTLLAFLFRIINLSNDFIVVILVLITSISFLVMMYTKE
jgi:hypothetical protein|tara:strand:- start:274 stop:576 length:303 start_codon:yes stop_codon:yes gene_type:complete